MILEIVEDQFSNFLHHLPRGTENGRPFFPNWEQLLLKAILIKI